MEENDEQIKEQEPDKIKEKNTGNIIKISGIVLGVIAFVLLVLIFLTVGYGKIYDGVVLNGIEIGGKTVEDAAEIINKRYKDVKDIEITLVGEEYSASFSGKEINTKMDGLAAAREAYDYARTGNLIEKIINGLKARFTKQEIIHNVSYDRLKLDSQINKITKNIEKAPSEPSYVRKGDSLIIKTGVTGTKVNHEETTKNILEGFNLLSSQIISIAKEEIKPERVDIDKIQKQIKTDVQNAEYLGDEGIIVDQMIGIEIKDVLEAKKIAESVTEEGMQFSVELLITLPETTTENVLKELFKDELSTYTTYFNVNEKSRTENVVLAASFINGTILMPGQEFSYNKIVGERSLERGFKTAKVYQEGAVVDGLGGGICQVSSTLYNSAVMADLEILERRNHSLTVSYVKLGRDATVVYGTTDFRFKNNQQYPIKIVAETSGGTLTVKMLGIDLNKERSVDIRTETVAVLPFAKKEITDNTLSTGMRIVTQTGKKGYKVASYRVTKENGTVIEDKLISTDTYSPIAEIVKVGPSI